MPLPPIPSRLLFPAAGTNPNCGWGEEGADICDAELAGGGLVADQRRRPCLFVFGFVLFLFCW
jgi:hypothetical protein